MNEDQHGWLNALSLAERVADSRRSGRSASIPSDPDAAAWRLAKWRAQSPFEDSAILALRLETDGLDEAEWHAMLGEGPEELALRSQARPAWLKILEEAFEEFARGEPIEVQPALRKDPRSAFLPFLAPLLRWGLDRVERGFRAFARDTADLRWNAAIGRQLAAGLQTRLLAMTSRTLAVELHVARLEERLQGETPQERFEAFLAQLSEPRVASTLFAEYPVLGRQLGSAVALWVEASLEFLHRLDSDWPAIRSALASEDDPGPLVDLEPDAGDSHYGGRTVMIARFQSGFQVVYKPKPLGIDVHFRELLSWLEERGAPDLVAPRVLDRGTYGWAEFIPLAPCHSLSEVERFYRRQGANLAILYALEATDFHNDNLIAAGAYPVLVDLESLFHPRFTDPDDFPPGSAAARVMLDSVLRVGLLPQRHGGGAESAGLELSGLGGQEGQLTNPDIPYWTAGGTDEMRLARGRGRFAGGKNRPRLDGEDVDVLSFTEPLLEGFTTTYGVLLTHREELLGDSGPIARFADDKIRVILRHTAFYSLLLRESFHPDLLRNALDYDRILDRLWYGVDRAQSERVARIIPSEREDLWRGDIPAFSTTVTSRDLWNGHGRPIPEFLAASGQRAVRDRLAKLGPEDLALQQWFLRASLTALAMDAVPAMPARRAEKPRGHATKERLVAAARAIGDRLERLSLKDRESCSWVGLNLTGAQHWSLSPLQLDLYSGLPGVVLFLALLADLTAEERYRDLARVAWSTVLKQIDRAPDSIQTIGGFEGWGGLLYTMTALGTLWKEPALLARATGIAATLRPLIDKDRNLDILGGSAGCIAALLALHHATRDDAVLEIARHCGERLISAAEPMAVGAGWRTAIAPRRPIAGFSHGAAGISWALLELAARTGDERFAACGRAGLAYESSIFDTEASNWPDLRQDDDEREGDDRKPKFMTAWCHGAPGIALSRLRLLRMDESGLDSSQIEAALRTTLRFGFGSNQSLCHGDLGNIEAIREASLRLPGSASWQDELGQRSAVILEAIERDGPRCGVPLGVETPGLFVGLAGVGLGLLRLAAPDRVPCILLLDPVERPSEEVEPSLAGERVAEVAAPRV